MAPIISRIVLWSLFLTLLMNSLSANSLVPLVESKNKELFDENVNAIENEVMTNAMLSYLLNRSLGSKIRNLNTYDANDVQKKGNGSPNTYFKQCSFNAVSCFGKRK